MLPLDLHVLGLPPAFTLSQDQTLQLKLQTKRPKPFRQTAECDSSKAPQTLLFFFTCLDALCILDFHPSQGVHTSYLRTLSKIVWHAWPEGPASSGHFVRRSRLLYIENRSRQLPRRLFLRRTGPLPPPCPTFRFAASCVSSAGRAYYIRFRSRQRLWDNFFAGATTWTPPGAQLKMKRRAIGAPFRLRG